MRLLIADDHEVVRRGVRTLLQEQGGWEVCAEASDGFEAIEKAKQVSPDVIVLDVSMPGMNGLEAARILRRIVPESEIVILSQHESAEMLRQAITAGARGYVVKSSVGRDLVTAVEKVSRHEPFFDPKIVPIEDWSGTVDTQEVLQRGVALEKALRESEERYRALVTATADAVWRADPDGNFIWISPSWTDLTGFRLEAALRPRWIDSVHPIDQKRVRQAFQECIRTGHPYHVEFRVQVKDGSYRHFSAKAVPVRNPDNSIREWIGTFNDFTERKQAELALAERETHLRVAQQAAQLATWVWNPTNNESVFSPELEEMFGFKANPEVQFEEWRKGVDGEDLPRVTLAMEAGAESGTLDIEYRYHHPRRGLRWYYCRGSRVRPEDPRLFGILLDVTEKKRTEEDLIANRERLTLALEAAQSGSFEWNIQNNVNSWSPEIEALYGLPLGGFGGTYEDWLELVLPEDREAAHNAGVEALKTGVLKGEWRIRRKSDGQIRSLHAQGKTLYDENGKPWKMIGINVDVTARKQTERALREHETHLQLAQAAAGVGTWEYDPKQHVRRNWSAETYQIFGIDPSAGNYHEQWVSRVHPQDIGRVQRTLENAGDSIVEVEYRYDHPVLGERWMFSKGRMLSREGEPVVFGISMDITERKQTEELLRKEREGLEAVVEQRTASLRRLSTRLLHLQDTERRRIARELHDSVGQELIALKLHLEELKKSNGATRHLVEECQNAVDVCLTDIRTISHLLHPPLLDEAGLASAARWYVEGFSARSGIPVSLDIPESLERLSSVAETALFRVLQESLTNIHRHSGSRTAAVQFEVLEHSVRLIVSDDGKGISPRTLERFRTAGTDVGVGLSGMRERIAELGGKLDIRSGSGTTVTATVPFSSKQAKHLTAEATAQS